MLKQAAKEYHVDLKRSYMVGDRISDIIAGYLAGCKTVLCTTGKHIEKMITTDLVIPKYVKPDIVVGDISYLKDVIS